MISHRRRSYLATGLGVLICAVGRFDCAQAQAKVPQQYVVIYGELATDVTARIKGEFLLKRLAEVAKYRFGAEYFTVNFGVDRPSTFNITEVWKDGAIYSTFSGSNSTRNLLASLTPILLAPLDERDGNVVAP